MSAQRRDLVIAGCCAAFIVGSLLLVRTVTAPTSESLTTAMEITTAQEPPQANLQLATATAASAAATISSSPPPNLGTIRGPIRTFALNPGVSVTPHPVTPGSAAAAPTTGLPANLPVGGDLPTDPTTAEVTAASWITALCGYDWQQPEPTTHQRRAQAFGDTTMPFDADPFTFDPAGWAHIKRSHQASACTGTSVTVDPAPPDHPGTSTVRITTIQLIAVDGTPIQQMTLYLTRTLEQTGTGSWRIGRPVTAN